jgi:hypothetical protein
MVLQWKENLKYWQFSLEELAEAIGKAIVEHSPILQEWKD